MKIIQIPTTSNPFIVNINNNVYQYRAGDTIEVPDEVAAVIEDALELEPKPVRSLSLFAKYVEGSVNEIEEEDMSGIKGISPYTFYQRQALRKIEIPEGVDNIGAYAISFCLQLTSIEIPSSVTVIHYRAFSGSSNLSQVTFADNSLLQEIKEHAFTDCTSLKRVVMKATTPPIIQANTFANVPAACVFEVPADALAAYKSAANWSALAGQIVAIKE